MGSTSPLRIDRESVVRLWLHRQGLSRPRGESRLTKRRFVDHLERTGALQLDTINVVDRAHYLTLWSRFGAFDRRRVDRWIYRDRVAYEYWGHEASVLPISHLPLGRRRMRGFPPKSWTGKSWWSVYATSPASKRRVLGRLREEGPLESADFERRDDEFSTPAARRASLPLPKEDKRSLKLFWHDGRVAVRDRRHFRCVYDLAERVYPQGPTASRADYEDSWLLTGLSGNGVASERHLHNYWTAPSLSSADRRRVIARNLGKKRIVEVNVEGLRGPFYVLPDQLDALAEIDPPRGTTLLCPFDSLLWQRARAEELLGFRYRIEIYVPPSRREFGYYVLPILHHGRLVGRLDPKLHRDGGVLEIRSLRLGTRLTRDLASGLRESLADLAEFLEATDVRLPRGWSRRLT